MIATAHVTLDRSHFELHYGEWLQHRSRFRRYEIWFAIVLLSYGLILAFTFRDRWYVGALFAAAGVYEFLMASTHKRRWVNARVAAVRADTSVDLEFHADSIVFTTANGTATVRWSGFVAFTQATNGFFLVPETGVSMYIPRVAVEPSAAYAALIDLIASKIKPPGEQ